MADSHFTVDEANALLPTVRPLVERMAADRRLGEDGIAWWHTVDGGFSGRRPL